VNVTDKLSLKDRIGVDLGRRCSLEDGIEWAAANAVYFVDAQTDVAPNAMEDFDDARCARIRELCDSTGVHLGLHTLSAVNIAEYSPFCREAADEYLKAYIDLAARLGAGWTVVHGGYHFTSDRRMRIDAAVERLKRIAGYAEERGALLLLENLNWEPDHAEVNYLPVTPAECQEYFARIDSPAVRWSFTANHAHFLPGVGIEKFIDAMDFSLCHEVRIADNNGEYEIHQRPGEGTVNFGELFAKLEGIGYRGHYMNGFGSLDDMLIGRDYIVERARESGVDVE